MKTIDSNKVGCRFKSILIENYLKEHNISKTKFCKDCNINYNALNKILNNKYQIKFSTLFKVCKKLEIEIYQFFY